VLSRTKLLFIDTVILILLISLLLGCNAVSQEEYNRVKSELSRLQEQLKEYQANAGVYKPPSERTVIDGFEPANPVVRDKAALVVAEAPADIDSNSEEWKIWQINYWVSQNIRRVSDPIGQEYLAYASETLETRAGDCDDFSILLTSMYEAVGLDAAIVYLDTNDDGEADHMAALVYYPRSDDFFIATEKDIMDKMGLKSRTGFLTIRFWEASNLSQVLGKYDKGIWLVVDPVMGTVKEMVGYVTHEPYSATDFVDVGG